MSDASTKHFGYLIAYVLPGFVMLWGLRPLSPTIDAWLSTSPAFPAGIEAVAFVGLAAIAAGMTVSAARWLLIDSMHAWSGLPRPIWNDANLNERLSAFEALVDAHFRYYQFYANMAVATAAAFLIALWTEAFSIGTHPAWSAAFAGLEVLFLVSSRDNLQRYYRRASRLLGETRGKEVKHDKRTRQAPKTDQTERF